MVPRKLVVPFVALAVLLSSLGGSAQTDATKNEPVRFQWKFEKDKPFFEESVTDTKHEMKVMGMDVKQHQKMTVWTRLTPTGRDEARNWTVVRKIERIKMDLEIGGVRVGGAPAVSFDSDNPGANFTLARAYAPIIGSESTYVLSPEMRILKATFKKSQPGDPAMAPLIDQILNEQAVKLMGEQVFGVFPAQGARKGETWKHETAYSMGPIGSYRMASTHTYDSREGAVDRVKVETAMTYQPPPADAKGGFKIKRGELTAGTEASALFRFNHEKGRIEDSDSTMDIRGKLTIEIGGMETEIDLFQIQKVVVKVSDAPPKK